MKFKHVGIFFSLLSGVFFIFCDHSGLAATLTPRQVVEKYCTLDLNGARLSSKTFGPIIEMMHPDYYNDEPGWDICIIISGYKILKEKHVTKNKVIISVRYDILAYLNGTPEIDIKRQEEVFDFIFINHGGSWKITNYVDYPRISIDTALASVNSLKQGTQDKEQMAAYNLVIKKIKELRAMK